MVPEAERRTLLLFAAVALLSGGNAVGVRFSNRELDPYWGSTIRFGLATLIALALVLALKHPMPRGRALLGAVLFGVFNFGGAFAFVYYALVRIPGGLGQTILALVPLSTLLLAVMQRQERLRPDAILGTVLAVTGVAIVSGVGFGDSLHVPSLLALLAATLCFGEGAVLVRRFPPVPPMVMNAIGMASGTAVLFAVALIARDQLTVPSLPETWVAILFLAPIGSVAVFAMYVAVLRRWSASRVAYVFVIVPVVALVLSAWLDDETIQSSLVLGGPLVLAGVYVGALRPAQREHSRQVGGVAHRPH